MRVPWQTAPRWAHPEGLARKGWTQLADGGVEIPLWSNGKGVIGAFREKQREGGVLGVDRFWYTCSETGPKLKLLVEDLRSAERVEALAEAEVDQLLEDILPECDDGELDKVWAASVEEVYSVALDEQLERDEKMLKDACVAEIFEDIGKLQKQCRKFARKKLGKEKETWLDPPGEDFERARCLWLGNYPELIEEIMMNFRSYSHRRLNGNLLAYVRKFLKERGRRQCRNHILELHRVIGRFHHRLPAHDAQRRLPQARKSRHRQVAPDRREGPVLRPHRPLPRPALGQPLQLRRHARLREHGLRGREKILREGFVRGPGRRRRDPRDRARDDPPRPRGQGGLRLGVSSLKFLAGYSLTHFGRLQQAGALLLAMGSWCRRAAGSRTPSRQCRLALRLATRRRPDGNDVCPRR